ncbi:MAG TPA: hypothetical protein VMP03_08535 [Methylomirabilota bacterium]|nr:hypothetical protein [Methylomirabilota bacterium]
MKKSSVYLAAAAAVAIGAGMMTTAMAASTVVVGGKTYIVYDGAKDALVKGNAKDNKFVGVIGRLNNDLTVKGGAGDDVFYATDLITETFEGGVGADTFVFGAETSDPYQSDTIADFNAAEGDVIDLRFMDANTKVPGHQAFTFIGDAPFQGTSGTYAAAGQLRIANGVLEGDTNGAFDEPELIVNLTGVSSVSETALVLGPSPYTGSAKKEMAKLAKAKAKGKKALKCQAKPKSKRKACKARKAK